jgi:hypothetical protein
MNTTPNYYDLLGVHPTTEGFVVRLAHKARRQELKRRQWSNEQELHTQLEELRTAEATLVHPERSIAYYLATGGKANDMRKIVVEVDLFDRLFSDIKRALCAAAEARYATMSELQKLELSRRSMVAESIMRFYADEQRSFAQAHNKHERRSAVRALFLPRESSEFQIRKSANETRVLSLRKDWVALGITEDVLDSSVIWISSERQHFEGLSDVGVRRTKLWLERTRSEIRRQLSNSVRAMPFDLWAEAPLTFGDASEFQELDLLLSKSDFSQARAEYLADEGKEVR